MTALAVGLVLGSAVLHATWNLIAKRAGGGIDFLWLFAVLTVLLYAPVAGVYAYFWRPGLSLAHLGLALVSAVVHIGYFICLQRGYRVGDLSLVYPVARGSGPVLATFLAVTALGERPSALTITGTALVVLSVFGLTSGGARTGGRGSALAFGLLTGVFIGIYTVWDGYAVGHAGAAPLLFTFTSEVFRALLLTPLALRRSADLGEAWRRHRWHALGVATLSPLAYLMVLSAMQFTPISQVAPAREISILIGTLLGTRLLAEQDGRRRLLGAAGMVIGVALLALG